MRDERTYFFVLDPVRMRVIANLPRLDKTGAIRFGLEELLLT